MKSLYENNYTVTKSVWLEWSKKPIQMGKYIGIKCLKFLGLVISMVLMGFSTTGDIFIGTAICAVATLFFYHITFFRDKKVAVKKYTEMIEARPTKKWIYTVRFLSEKIEVLDNNRRESSYGYKEIRKIITRGNFYILLIDKDFGLRIKKEKFTLGDEKECIKFIKEKIKIDPENKPLEIAQ